MILTCSIAGLTTAFMVASIIVKPYFNIGKVKLGSYYLVSILGAICILAFGRISFGEFIDGITANTSVNPLKILTLFISMTLLSIYLGDAGFFSFIALKIFDKTRGGGIKLFTALYFVVAVLTVFTSNDVIILTFTPPICIFCKKAKISPIPYLIGEFVAANTWSMMLIVGNPTNIYLAGSSGLSFFEYLKKMFLPAIFGGLSGFITLLLIFRKTLLQAGEKTDGEKEEIYFNKFLVTVALIHLIICIILLTVSDFLGIEMWIICAVLAVSLTAFNLVYGIVKDKSAVAVLGSLKKAPYELIPFVLSMFAIVLALSKCNLTGKLAELLITNTKADGIIFGFISAISANLLNNIPMSVLFEKISSGNLYALLGSVIGSNIGAFITPVGALAGIMWNKILSSYEIKFPLIKFILYGGICATVSLTFSTLALFLF